MSPSEEVIRELYKTILIHISFMFRESDADVVAILKRAIASSFETSTKWCKAGGGRNPFGWRRKEVIIATHHSQGEGRQERLWKIARLERLKPLLRDNRN
ncbi:hypothetical protein TNCT_538711 [Trichonephila clavata]|uniref:Uncharacterized protein n=1 Tax=Trichonephila clavata TaxID=2740835 RepID=A0A8X6J237_TRICU|nr:hypothetical protein TNCT_538711 [Trichonephila clavata]